MSNSASISAAKKRRAATQHSNVAPNANRTANRTANQRITENARDHKTYTSSSLLMEHDNKIFQIETFLKKHETNIRTKQAVSGELDTSLSGINNNILSISKEIDSLERGNDSHEKNYRTVNSDLTKTKATLTSQINNLTKDLANLQNTVNEMNESLKKKDNVSMEIKDK